MVAMGSIRLFRDGFKRLTPQREYIYNYCQGIWDDFSPYGDWETWKRRKWSRIRKVNHRNKKSRKWVIDDAETFKLACPAD